MSMIFEFCQIDFYRQRRENNFHHSMLLNQIDPIATKTSEKYPDCNLKPRVWKIVSIHITIINIWK